MIVLEILSTLLEFLTECHFGEGDENSASHSGFCVPLFFTLFIAYMGIIVYNFLT